MVGWYRVAAAAAAGQDAVPTADDLKITAQLQQHYGGGGSDDSNLFVFVLLQAPSHSPSRDTKPSAQTGTTMAANDQDNDDDDLPLQFYRLAPDTQKSLHALENWSLETFEPERIAVEHVVRSQPRPSSTTTTTTSNEKSSSAFFETTQSVQHSWHMMHERMSILEQFLVDTEAGRIPWQPALMRQIQSLMTRLGPLAAAAVPDEGEDLVQPLAVLTKTVDAVQSYADKFRTVHEAPAPRPRETRSRRMLHHQLSA